LDKEEPDAATRVEWHSQWRFALLLLLQTQ
jgi:hypothetical protein